MGDKEEHWEREKSCSMRNTRTTEGTQKLGERGNGSSRRNMKKVEQKNMTGGIGKLGEKEEVNLEGTD